MTRTYSATRLTLAALAMAGLLAATAIGGPILQRPGVLGAGTVDPWHPPPEQGGAVYGWSDGPTTTWQNKTEDLCVAGVCFFRFEEHRWHTTASSRFGGGSFAASAHEDLSGYYVDLLDGVFWGRLRAGEVASARQCASSQGASDLDDQGMWNNLGYSERHLRESSSSAETSCGEQRRVSLLAAETALQTPVASWELDAAREQRGTHAQRDHRASASSEHSRDEYLGVPAQESGAREEHRADSASASSWNRTSADSSFFLINPRDATTVDIVGLGLDKGDEATWSEDSHADEEGSYQKALGMAVVEEEDADSGRTRTTAVQEWLHLVVDLQGGTVTGDVSYRKGASSTSTQGARHDRTSVLGVPFGSQGTSEAQEDQRWRDAAVDLDAAQGMAGLRLAFLDRDEARQERSTDEVVVFGVPAGVDHVGASRSHTDAVELALEAGRGLLWLRGGYTNHTSTSSTRDDVTLDGDPIGGYRQDRRDDHRGVDAAAGTSLGGQAHTERQDFTRENRTAATAGGEEIGGVVDDDRGTRTAFDAETPEGVLRLDFAYVEGQSVKALTLDGERLGEDKTYQTLEAGASGHAPGPLNPGVFTYSFRHRETRSDATYLNATRFQENVTEDDVSFDVLHGRAGLKAHREFRTTQVSAGDTEVLDFSNQAVEAEAHAGEVQVDAGAAFGYGDVVDSLAAGGAGGRACAQPGEPANSALQPAEAAANAALQQGLGAVGGALPLDPETLEDLALVVDCGNQGLGAGAGAPLLLFLLSPCVLYPLVEPLAYDTLYGVATGLAPQAGPAFDAGRQRLNATYEEHIGCRWLTLPAEARNPQPALDALGAGEAAAAMSAAPVFLAYDRARAAAGGDLDAAMGLDALVQNPAGVPGAPGVPAVPPL